MSENKRNVDTENLSKESDGSGLPTGTGTHDRHRVEAERATEDNKAKGTEGRKAGYGKGNTAP
jgi:hypothetical protein